MKKIIFASFAVLGIGMAGCSNEEEWGVAQKGIDEINASMETEGSRTGMNGNSVVWSEKDAISVFTQSDDNIYNNMYTLKDGVGTGNATFSGQIEGDSPVKLVALYPYAEDATYDKTKVTLTMKTTYEYAENSNNSAPMACLIKPESPSALAFKNAGALMSVTVNNIPAGYNKATLTSKAAKDNNSSGTAPALTGKAEITFNADGNPALVMSNDGDKGEVITITFTANTSTPTNKTFYFPIPVAEYPALEVAISENGNDEKVLKTKGLKAERSQRYTSTITLDEVSGNVPKEVASVSEVTDALSENNSVSVANVASGEPAITLPDKEADNMSISFDKISTTSAIKVTGTPSGSNVAKEVLISVPQQTSGEQSPKFEIELPESTVTLAANGEVATYEEVTATTAQNTLIVGKGVTVKKLIVKGGNVRVNDGATVSVIERGGGNQATVTIYKEEGANLPNLSSNTAFSVVDADIADLQNVAKEGGTYTLTKDLTGDFTISATSEVIINLNGHKITNKSGDTFTVNQNSKLTISGSGTVDNVTHQKACIYNNGTVILNGGTYTRSKENGINKENSGGNSYYNILNHGEMTINPNVEVSQGGHFSSLIDNGYYNYNSGTPRSGYVGSTNHQNPSLVINGGMFSGGINTIKNDDGAILTIVKGTFTNMTQATVQNNNIAEIRGGEFNPTGSATHAVETKAYAGSNNKGETTISGGTFKGELYLYNGANINTASFNITGGTFSDPGALAYFGDNANATIKLNADMQLAKSMVVEKGTATIDLNGYTLTAADTATVEIKENTNKVVAIAVKDGAQATVTNGNIGDNTDKLSYGIYAFGKAKVTLNNVSFGEMVTYAYNGAGTLAATGCTFKGWLSGWHNGGTFTDCTFTIGKAYYPATICYGNTTFTNCKFFKNGVDADTYDDKNSTDADGYYRCNYVVAQCDPSKSIGFTSCKFINENNEETGSVAKDNHPFHACGWGNGTAANYNVTVDATAVTSRCSGANK